MSWFFKRRKPSHRATVTVPTLALPDLRIARWLDMTEDEWSALPILAKVDHREAYYRTKGLAG